ncbi:ABC transporter ATP-binding protein [Oleidesulfovibrio alaskensis]
MAQTKDIQKVVWLIKRYAMPRWRLLLVLLASNVGVVLLSITMPLLLAPLVDLAVKGVGAFDELYATGNTFSLQGLAFPVLSFLNSKITISKLIVFLALAYIALAFLKGIFSFFSYLLALRLRVSSAASIQLDVYSHILKQPVGFFSRQRAGELISRLDTDVNAATYGFEGIFIPLCVAPPIVIFYGTLLYRTNPVLVIAGVTAFVLHYVVSKLLMKRIRKRLSRQFTVLSDFKARLHETVVGVRVVKVFCAEDMECSKMQSLLNNVIPAQMAFGKWKHMEAPLRETLNHALEMAFLGIAAAALHDGVLDTSAFLLFILIGKSLMAPLSQLAGTLTVVQTMLASMERVFELLDVTPSVVDGTKQAKPLERDIQLHNVSFEYRSGSPVLFDVNLKIKKGEVVALVGPSGSGKSTLVDVLLRFMDPTAGQIFWDGSPISSFSQKSYRALFGVVPQEPMLFNMSVAENIAYGRGGLTLADVVCAAKLANAHGFISKLPDGYNTNIGERGVMLSGGQKQRLCIARAVVARPAVLVLDEATSSLDSSSEAKVQAALDRSIKGATAIVIAHRLATVRQADKIIVLDAGRIESVGTYQELLEHSALFRTLHDTQFCPVR